MYPGLTMRHLPFILILSCLVLALVSLINDGGVARKRTLEQNLERQRAKNEELKGYVNGLRKEIYALSHDNRAIEKAARNELGMARPNELVFFFEESKNSTGEKP